MKFEMQADRSGSSQPHEVWTTTTQRGVYADISPGFGTAQQCSKCQLFHCSRAQQWDKGSQAVDACSGAQAHVQKQAAGRGCWVERAGFHIGSLANNAESSLANWLSVWSPCDYNCLSTHERENKTIHKKKSTDDVSKYRIKLIQYFTIFLATGFLIPIYWYCMSGKCQTWMS